MSLFTLSSVPLQKGCRWFLTKGASTKYDRGFRSKEEANGWITSFWDALDWLAG